MMKKMPEEFKRFFDRFSWLCSCREREESIFENIMRVYPLNEGREVSRGVCFNGGVFLGKFHYNTKYIFKVSLAEAIRAFLMDAYAFASTRNLDDFSKEYGYYPDDEKALKAFEACQKTYYKLIPYLERGDDSLAEMLDYLEERIDYGSN